MQADRSQHLAGPWRITFDTNPDDCNLHCIMCEERSPFKKSAIQPAREPRRMDPELIRFILTECGETVSEVIPSTMGEPLLYRHFDTILDQCCHLGIKLNLTTNGTFPGKGATAWAEAIVPITSDVKISWNGATKETGESIMVGTTWDDVLDNVRQFISVRDAYAAAGGNHCRVTFQLTFMEKNLVEIPDIVRLAAELGVDRVKGHHLWTHFPELEKLSLKRNADAVACWNETVDATLAVAAQHRFPSGKEVLLENFHHLSVDESEEVDPTWDCPFLGREAWINWEGRFCPCCAPDEQRKALGDFGKVQDRGVLSIWRSEQYQALLTDHKDHSLCRRCNMRRPGGAQ